MNLQKQTLIIFLSLISTSLVPVESPMANWPTQPSFTFNKSPILLPNQVEESSPLTGPLWKNNKPTETWITVFIHGIKSIKPHITLTNFIRFMTDTTDDTLYSQTVKFMRQDRMFYQNQPMQDVGLIKIDTNRVEKGYAAGAMAVAFEKTSELANPDKKLNNYYYTFGWSGIMSARQRYLESVKLYQELGKEIETFRARGIEPKIRIVAYSHGGNVALNTGLAKKNNKTPYDFYADELVLIGVPIQNETDYLINEPFFKKVYHIYSRSDHVQKLDFFSFNRFFSQRVFKPRKCFQLPEKLIQIQLKCTRTVKHHCSKNKEHDNNSNHNYTNKAVVSGKSRHLRNSSPGHIELWFFSWTPANYRKTFPLNPLPAAAFTPLILREADHFEEKGRFTKPTLIDIRPQQEIVIVKNQKSNTVLNVSQFLPKKEFNNLAELVLKYKPDVYTEQMYNQHIRDAYNRAQDMKNDQGRLKRAKLRAKRKAKKERRHKKHEERKACKIAKHTAKVEERARKRQERLERSMAYKKTV